jgi:hypothetical protein
VFVAEDIRVKRGNVKRVCTVPDPSGGVADVGVEFPAIAIDFKLMFGTGEFTVALTPDLCAELHRLTGEAAGKKTLIIANGHGSEELRQ